MDRVGQILGDVVLAELALMVSMIALIVFGLAVSFIKSVFFE